MAKDWNWQEGKAKFKDNDGDEHDSVVEYAVVDDATAGQEVNTTLGARVVQAGDVLVKNPGDNSGRYDVHNADSWKGTEYGGSSNDDEDKPSDSPVVTKPSVPNRK